jgi:hypothetical protein
MPKLVSMRDKHIATVQVDRFNCLASVTRTLTTEGSNVDFGFPFLDSPSGRVLLYVNGVEPLFADTDFWIPLDRGRGNVLYVGMVGGRNEDISSDPRGPVVLTGWNPLTDAR